MSRDATIARLWHAGPMATKPRGPLKRARPRESLIEMERWHLREGESRIALQEEIVTQLDANGGPESEHVLTARALLVTFHKFLALARQRLEELEREQP
jgi:hypothetical protein